MAPHESQWEQNLESCFLYSYHLSYQSYGGFCAVTHLSFAPQGLKQVLLTGGIPPIRDGCAADSVYHTSFEKFLLQNEKYYQIFPQDVEVVQDIVSYLAKFEGGRVPLPSGTPSQWAAQRIRETEANGSKFDAIKAAERGDLVYFTGEVVIHRERFVKKKPTA